ncbi:MAG: endonuclease/exonuclease/phosphatase family protein [Nitrosospira sp.]|nr:endonuclease/exonuclease/phosphatase family protein [Nitrosospira sp.]
MGRLIRWFVLGLGTAAVVVTFLPTIQSNQWWIRIWDFPRIQLSVVLAIALIATTLTVSLRRLSTLLFMAVLASALVWQLRLIGPYTPIFSTEAKAVSICKQDSQIRLLVANVLYGSRNAEPLLALVRKVEPDVLLLVETDPWWERHLEPLHAQYPHFIGHPQNNGYGISLFSRFEMIDAEIRFLLEDYVPSIKTGLRLPSGARIDLYGLHPKPPFMQDTKRRDAELLIAGREVRHELVPAIVAGDLNDVAWSRSTRLFQEISGLLDPRIGRGPYSTFNANWPLLRWPLDHVFFEESFWLLEVAVMPDIGSDHFPFFVALCHDPAAARTQSEPQTDQSDVNNAREAIREGKKEAQE